MTRDQLKAMVVITTILMLSLALMALLATLQAESYKRATYDNCKQYNIVPEEYVHQVPDGCVTQYWENRALK